MNTNPYDPPRSPAEPRKRSLLMVFLIAGLMLFGMTLVVLLLWKADEATVAPIEVEVYDSMSPG